MSCAGMEEGRWNSTSTVYSAAPRTRTNAPAALPLGRNVTRGPPASRPPTSAPSRAPRSRDVSRQALLPDAIPADGHSRAGGLEGRIAHGRRTVRHVALEGEEALLEQMPAGQGHQQR